MALAKVANPKHIDTLTPPLKWAGGKRWLVPTLQHYWQKSTHKRLVEPFCGGLAVALGLQPQQALLNDANPHAINFYRQLQDGLIVQESFENDRTYFFKARELFNQLILSGHENTSEAAEWFYYLNRTGFNGLCRFNRKGLFNVPFGQYKTISYPKDFLPYQETLSPWLFTEGDFEALSCTLNDFIYADPPYDVAFVQYAQGGFTWDDQVRLAHWLVAQPCPVIASNQATPRILELYQDLGFQVSIKDAPRRISCTGDRTPAQEILALKRVK